MAKIKICGTLEGHKQLGNVVVWTFDYGDDRYHLMKVVDIPLNIPRESWDVEKPRVENDEFYEHYAFADDDDYYDADPEKGSDEWWELQRDECGWFEDTCLQTGTEYCDFKCAMRSIYEDEAENVESPPYGDMGIGGGL